MFEEKLWLRTKMLIWVYRISDKDKITIIWNITWHKIWLGETQVFLEHVLLKIKILIIIIKDSKNDSLSKVLFFWYKNTNKKHAIIDNFAKKPSSLCRILFLTGFDQNNTDNIQVNRIKQSSIISILSCVCNIFLMAGTPMRNDVNTKILRNIFAWWPYFSIFIEYYMIISLIILCHSL
jgi:hypothetical protein